MRVDILSATLVQRWTRRKWDRNAVQIPLESKRSADFSKIRISGSAAAIPPQHIFSQELALSRKLSSNARIGSDILPLCQTMDKSHVACFSATGTITTFGMLRCEIKLGSNLIAPSLAEITRLSARLFVCPIETNRGRNLPNRMQNRAIL
jgi:hypothetical protein